MNQNELAILIADCLKRGKRIYQGRVLGASNAGSKVSVEMSVAVPGFGSVVNATALNDCIGGAATAFLGDDGNWLALSNNNVSFAPVTQITSFRRRRKREIVNITSPFKTLFVEVDPLTKKTILYVGGDRPGATPIGEI